MYLPADPRSMCSKAVKDANPAKRWQHFSPTTVVEARNMAPLQLDWPAERTGSTARIPFTLAYPEKLPPGDYALHLDTSPWNTNQDAEFARPWNYNGFNDHLGNARVVLRAGLGPTIRLFMPGSGTNSRANDIPRDRKSLLSAHSRF